MEGSMTRDTHQEETINTDDGQTETQEKGLNSPKKSSNSLFYKLLNKCIQSSKLKQDKMTAPHFLTFHS